MRTIRDFVRETMGDKKREVRRKILEITKKNNIKFNKAKEECEELMKNFE